MSNSNDNLDKNANVDATANNDCSVTDAVVNPSTVKVNRTPGTVLLQQKVITVSKVSGGAHPTFGLDPNDRSRDYEITIQTKLSGVQNYNVTNGFFQDLFARNISKIKPGTFLHRLMVAWKTVMNSSDTTCNVTGGFTDADVEHVNAERDIYFADKAARAGVKTTPFIGQRDVHEETRKREMSPAEAAAILRTSRMDI